MSNKNIFLLISTQTYEHIILSCQAGLDLKTVSLSTVSLRMQDKGPQEEGKEASSDKVREVTRTKEQETVNCRKFI